MIVRENRCEQVSVGGDTLRLDELIVDLQGAARRQVKACDKFEKRRLSRTVTSRDKDDATTTYFQLDRTELKVYLPVVIAKSDAIQCDPMNSVKGAASVSETGAVCPITSSRLSSERSASAAALIRCNAGNPPTIEKSVL